MKQSSGGAKLLMRNMPRFSKHPVILATALLAGIALAWASKQRYDLGLVHILLLLAIAVVAMLPVPQRAIVAALDRLRHPSPKKRFRNAILISILATIYLFTTAFGHGREVFPKCHDENSYVIQARILATGHLWLPMHPLADFFECFHMITKPVYAPIYFPGTALMNVPMAWLGLPEFVIPMLLSGIIVGLVYRVITEITDGVGGLLAALFTLAAVWFRTNSTLVMSQSPSTLLGLLLFWAWLRWRTHRDWKWALLIGIFAGWAAITRPVDALAFAIPVGIAMLTTLIRSAANLRQWLTTAGLVLAGSIPLLSLQLTLNYGTTGNPLESPYVEYLKTSQPATSYGYHAWDPDLKPTSTLLQKHAYYARFLRGSIEEHRIDRIGSDIVWRLQRTADVVFPWRVLLVLVPIGLLGLCNRERIAFAAVLPLFVGLYVPNTYYLEHYIMPLIAPAALLVILAIDVVRRASLPSYIGRAVTVFATLSVAFLSIAAFPEFRAPYEDDTHYPERELIHRMIETDIKKPALLLVHFDMTNNAHDEPVYNSDVAWPDDAPVVRAHDFGPERRLEVLDYYAQKQPDRQVYLYDRPTKTLYGHLGTVAEYRETLRKQLAIHRAKMRAATVPSTSTAPIIKPTLSQEH